MMKLPQPTETSPLLVAAGGGESPSSTAASTPPQSFLGLFQDDGDDCGTASSTTSFAASPSAALRKLSMSVRSFVHAGSIGYLGSVAIAANSLTGPAMLNLPATFSKSGIVPTAATLLFVCILSALCCMHLSNTISKVKKEGSSKGSDYNVDFKQEVEYSDVFGSFWGRRWFAVTQILFFCCVTCLNVSSIVDTAQVVDTFLGHWWPKLVAGSPAAALEIKNNFRSIAWVYWDYSMCDETDLAEGDCLPFAQYDDGIVVTPGNVIVTFIFLPLALLDLKENAFAQIVGFAVLIVTSLQFVIQFAMSIDFQNVTWSWWGYDWDDLFGVTLFNFALVIAIPAWLYEREAHVDVPTVIRGSAALSLVLYLSIGLLGSLAMPKASENMLQSMMSGSMGTSIELGASVFAFFIVGLGIPLFSVLARLNLTGSRLCSRRVGDVLAVYLPFALSWVLNDSGVVTKLLSWGGTFFTSLIAFILPLLLTIHVAKTCDDREGSVSVYWGWFASKRSELISLYILLGVTVFAIAFAIVGNIFV